MSFQQSRESERSREVKRQRKDGEPQRLSIPSRGQRGSLDSAAFSHQKQSTFNIRLAAVRLYLGGGHTLLLNRIQRKLGFLEGVGHSNL